MIGKLLSGLFNLILTLAGTILQIVLAPLNALFTGLFPSLSTWVSQVTTGFGQIFDGLGYAIGIVPPVIRSTLLIILTAEISLAVILRSAKLTSKLWTLIQKIKVW